MQCLVPLQLILTSENDCNATHLPKPLQAIRRMASIGSARCLIYSGYCYTSKLAKSLASLAAHGLCGVRPCATGRVAQVSDDVNLETPRKTCLKPLCVWLPMGCGWGGNCSGYRYATVPTNSRQNDTQAEGIRCTGFDFGTSPHGLSADNPPAHQETRCTDGPRFPAKPLLGEGQALPQSVGCDDASSTPQGWAGVIKLTAEQRDHLAFAVLCQVEGLYDSPEADKPEVLEAICHLEEVQRLLKVQP